MDAGPSAGGVYRVYVGGPYVGVCGWVPKCGFVLHVGLLVWVSGFRLPYYHSIRYAVGITRRKLETFPKFLEVVWWCCGCGPGPRRNGAPGVGRLPSCATMNQPRFARPPSRPITSRLQCVGCGWRRQTRLWPALGCGSAGRVRARPRVPYQVGTFVVSSSFGLLGSGGGVTG